MHNKALTQMIQRALRLACLLLTAAAPAFLSAAAPQAPDVPGVVIDYSPASSGLYIGSPGLAVWTNGNYLASHDFFGPKSREHELATSLVFRSTDKGKSWGRTAEIRGAFWSSLFVHNGAAYLMGTDRHHGQIVIRRSVDGGTTWTEPVDTGNGLLAKGQFHTAPMPVIAHDGRLWRAFEEASTSTKWGERYRAGMLSIAKGADPLVATNWTFSNFLASERTWNDDDMGGWLEGNAVLDPKGNVVNILRVETKDLPEKAAIVQVSADGNRVSFDPEKGFVDFPGGAKKFTIRHDPRSGRYWSLPTIVADKTGKLPEKPARIRNTLAISSSKDLKNWTVHKVILSHPDITKHGFQYVEWLVEGADIIFACRTAHDDGQGGAHNNHDANYLTFHRIENFRALE